MAVPPAETVAASPSQVNSSAPFSTVQTCSRSAVCTGPAASAAIRTRQVLSSVLPRLGAASPVMTAFGVAVT